MPAAYNPEVTNGTDQGFAPNPQKTASRFNSIDSRVGVTPVGATVTDAIAESKKGNFTLKDLKDLAFAMGYQIVEGKDTTALVAKIADLQKQVEDLAVRANNSEAAFAAANAELDAVKAAKQ